MTTDCPSRHSRGLPSQETMAEMTVQTPPTGCTTNGWGSSGGSPAPRPSHRNPAVSKHNGSHPSTASDRHGAIPGDGSQPTDGLASSSASGSYQLWVSSFELCPLCFHVFHTSPSSDHFVSHVYHAPSFPTRYILFIGVTCFMI